jgi:GIY-YIG catalytic domain
MMTTMNHRNPASIPGIYLITNTATGSVYVGQSRHIGLRWGHHRHCLAHGTHNNTHLQRAWDKYGSAAFVFSIAVDLSSIRVADLAAALAAEEARVFALFSSNYNILKPGVEGHIVPVETRQRLSVARKRAWDKALKLNPDIAREIAVRTNAWKRTEAGKAILSAWSKARWAKPAFRAMMAEISRVIWASPERCAANATRVAEAWRDPISREKRIAGIKAAWADPQVRARRLEAIKAGQQKAMADPNGAMRQRPKKRWADPDARAKQADVTAERWTEPEVRARQVAAMKASWARRKAAAKPEETALL